MMQNIRDNLHDIEDDEELEAYLKKLLHIALEHHLARVAERVDGVPPVSYTHLRPLRGRKAPRCPHQPPAVAGNADESAG